MPNNNNLLDQFLGLGNVSENDVLIFKNGFWVNGAIYHFLVVQVVHQEPQVKTEQMAHQVKMEQMEAQVAQVKMEY